MGTCVLCIVTFWLLTAGPADAGVTQTPEYQVMRTGQNMTLRCTQDMNHDSMYWYRQDPGLGLRLIYYSVGVDLKDEGEVPDKYSVSRPDTEHFLLSLETASASQTSVYFCASSDSTALHSHLLSSQKRRGRHCTPKNSAKPLAA